MARGLKAQLGDVVALLQEIPTWGPRTGYIYHNHALLAEEGSDCGFLIPRHWMPAVKSQTFRPYWAACVVGRIIFISAHILDHMHEDRRGRTVIKESLEYVSMIRNKYNNIEFELIVGADTNTTLPANYEDKSESFLTHGAHSHTLAHARIVTAWLAALVSAR